MSYVVINRRRFELPAADAAFSFGELADMENVAGAPLGTLGEQSARAMLAVIWVTLERAKSGITLEELRGLGPDDIEVVENDPDPPPAGEEAGDERPEPETEAATSGHLS